MLEIVYVPINDLIPANYNPRKISKKDAERIRQSLQEFGTVEPAVVNRHKGRENIVIGGHQRIEQAKVLGWESYPCCYVDLPLAQEKRLNLKLNKIGAEWDSDKLSLHFQMDDLLDAGFSQLDLNLKFAKVEYKDRKLEQAQSDYDMDDVGDFGESEPQDYPKPLPVDRPPQRSTTTDDTRQESNSQRHYPLPIVLDREQYALWCHAKDLLGQQGDKNALLALLQKAGIEPR